MNDVDRLIRDALGAENVEAIGDCGEPSIQDMVIDSFRGRTKWLVAMTFVGILVFVALAAFSAVQFFRAGADETHEMIKWSISVVFCLMAVGMMKIWYWMELNKNSILREVKRVELQMACLVQRQRDGK